MQTKGDMNKELLSIMACPKCRGRLELKDMFLLCEKCRLAFPILNKEIPDMLIKNAWDIEKAKRNGFKHKLRL